MIIDIIEILSATKRKIFKSKALLNGIKTKSELLNIYIIQVQIMFSLYIIG